jgi:catechol 2,3-dioxygenase-like lactoylglutathione lyase family enzyme
VPSVQGTAAVPRPPSPGLQFRPIVHVADLAASVAFYEDLGGEVIHGGPGSGYVLMQFGVVQIGLLTHSVDAGQGAVELNFVAAMPLGELEQRLRGRGVTIAEPVHSTDVGPQLHVRAPDGLLVRIGQLEPDDD